MSNWYSNFISLIKDFWSKIPNQKKEEIIDIVINSSKEVFKAYYRSEKKCTDKKNA